MPHYDARGTDYIWTEVGMPTMVPPKPAPTTASTPYTSLLGQYNQVPQPTSGRGAYGLVPGTTPLPPSTYTQTGAADPGLAAGNDQLNANILSELRGELSPQALENMQNTAARYGVTSGMPGSNAVPGSLAFNKNLLGNILTTQQIQHQGQQDYQSREGQVAGQQLDPALIARINQDNATLAAAPDPTTAAQTQLANYYAALNAAKGPGGGTGGPASPAGGTGQTGSGALGFGFNTLGQPTNPQQPNPSGDFGYNSVTSVPGATYVGANNDFFDMLNSDLGSPSAPLGPPPTASQVPIDYNDPSTWTDPGALDAFYATG